LRALVETEQVKQESWPKAATPWTSTPREYARDIDSERDEMVDAGAQTNLKVE